jgi:hypothetical protein
MGCLLVLGSLECFVLGAEHMTLKVNLGAGEHEVRGLPKQPCMLTLRMAVTSLGTKHYTSVFTQVSCCNMLRDGRHNHKVPIIPGTQQRNATNTERNIQAV